MLRAYGPGCDGSLIEAKGHKIPERATWIDLEEPTREEEELVERCLELDIPTPEELAEIEPSSRLYEKDGALYMTLSTLVGVADGKPAATHIGFVLAGERLVTVRYATPKPIRLFAGQARSDPALVRDSVTVLTLLLDSIIDRQADELEEAGQEIDRISSHTFGWETSKGRIPTERLQALLRRIGRAQQLLARIRETTVSAARVVGFLSGTARIQDSPEHRQKVRSLAADVNSLTEHSNFLASNLTFLLNASLGLISVEQNAIIKIFSVAAVIFLPPTLVGTVYGMNFEHMPELDWLLGYPFALVLMVMSAILPYWFFRQRGWL